jgi:hypothetical protein
MNLIGINRSFYPTTAEYILFSRDYGTLSRIYHMLGLKARLNYFKKI